MGLDIKGYGLREQEGYGEDTRGSKRKKFKSKRDMG